MLARNGEAVGRVDDVIVRLRGAHEYPLVTEIVAEFGGREACVGSKAIHEYAAAWVPAIVASWPSCSLVGGLNAGGLGIDVAASGMLERSPNLAAAQLGR